MAVTELKYEAELENESEEKINFTGELHQGEPRMMLEVPAYIVDGKVAQRAQRITLTQAEFYVFEKHVREFLTIVQGVQNV